MRNLKKIIVRLLCCIIPVGKWRRDLRTYLLSKCDKKMGILEHIFSIKNFCDKDRTKGKQITIFGVKIKVKNSSFGLNIGAGHFLEPGWDVVDWYIDDKYIDYKVNLLKTTNLPINDESYKYVFTSHLIEHLSNELDENLFKEVYRILKPNGIFRIACPDAEKALFAYKNNDKGFFYTGEIVLHGQSLERRLVNYFASFKCYNYGGYANYSGGPIIDDEIVKNKVNELSIEDFVKWCVSLIPAEAYYTAHINGHTYDKVVNMLKNAGFKNIERSYYRKSNAKKMRGK
ncbi:MAG: methyltransferase domain-containing protein [Alphaproteobacteria bacterium]|nr:methyltransferase domain-containing protein [Alphaproteobacteria bacterium]